MTDAYLAALIDWHNGCAELLTAGITSQLPAKPEEVDFPDPPEPESP